MTLVQEVPFVLETVNYSNRDDRKIVFEQYLRILKLVHSEPYIEFESAEQSKS